MSLHPVREATLCHKTLAEVGVETLHTVHCKESLKSALDRVIGLKTLQKTKYKRRHTNHFHLLSSCKGAFPCYLLRTAKSTYEMPGGFNSR